MRTRTWALLLGLTAGVLSSQDSCLPGKSGCLDDMKHIKPKPAHHKPAQQDVDPMKVNLPGHQIFTIRSADIQQKLDDCPLGYPFCPDAVDTESPKHKLRAVTASLDLQHRIATISVDDPPEMPGHRYRGDDDVLVNQPRDLIPGDDGLEKPGKPHHIVPVHFDPPKEDTGDLITGDSEDKLLNQPRDIDRGDGATAVFPDFTATMNADDGDLTMTMSTVPVPGDNKSLNQPQDLPGPNPTTAIITGPDHESATIIASQKKPGEFVATIKPGDHNPGNGKAHKQPRDLIPGDVDASPSVWKVITQTVTKTVDMAACSRCDWMKKTAMIATLGSHTIPITTSMQLVGNNTLVKIMPTPEAFLMPLIWDDQYLVGWEHLVDRPLREIMDEYRGVAHQDDLPRLAQNLREHNADIDPNMSMKYAMIMLLGMKHPAKHPSYPPFSHYEPDVREVKSAHVPGVADFRGPEKDHPVTRGQTVYELDPYYNYRVYHPYRHAIAPTRSCHARKHNGTKCQIDTCMWNFMKPITVTTAVPAVMLDRYGRVENYDYWTHTTELHWPHWGMSETAGLYYPTKTTFGFLHGTPTPAVVRAAPPDAEWKAPNHHHHRGTWRHGDVFAHGDPECHDIESCYNHCATHHKSLSHGLGHYHIPTWMWFVGPVLGVLLISLPLLLCCWCLKRRKRNGKDGPLDKLRKKRSKPTDTIVNQAAEPERAATETTAVVAGSAAGAEAAREKPAEGVEEGRGTTGRRAEEGRGRVNFEDGQAPGSEPAAAAQPAEHVESRPATDGAGDASGRQGPDWGSVRGRKRFQV